MSNERMRVHHSTGTDDWQKGVFRHDGRGAIRNATDATSTAGAQSRRALEHLRVSRVSVVPYRSQWRTRMTQQSLPIIHDTDDKASRLREPMMNVLRDSRWHTANELRRWIPELDDRTARAIAERSKGSILGSDRGYRLLAYCSIEEIQAVEDRLRSQARRMLRRVLDIRKARALRG